MSIPPRAPTVLDCPSPNHEARPAGCPIDILLLHYTGMPTMAAARERLCDTAAKVSCHYLIDEDGTVYRLVPEERRAWHAGVSCWAGERDVNSRSIGIELVNPGHDWGYRPFPAVQMKALTTLARDIMARHPIPTHRVLGHSDVAPSRKIDPGELFDWAALADAGVGLWTPRAGTTESHAVLGLGCDGPEVAELQSKLASFGYAVPQSGILDAATADVVAAFQRHFRPWRIDGQADDETRQRLYKLLILKDKA